MEKNTLKFNEDLIKNCDEDSNKGYILEVDVEYPKHLHSDLPLLSGKKKKNKCDKVVYSLYDEKKLCCSHKIFKTSVESWISIKKVQEVIQFNQKALLKEYIDMNIELRIEAKNEFEKDFFKVMNNAVFGKTMENVRKHRNIKLVKTDKRTNQLVSELNYHTIKYISENLLAIEIKKTKVKMNKPVYLGFSILEISKTLMYGFWYEYIKPKY